MGQTFELAHTFDSGEYIKQIYMVSSGYPPIFVLKTDRKNENIYRTYWTGDCFQTAIPRFDEPLTESSVISGVSNAVIGTDRFEVLVINHGKHTNPETGLVETCLRWSRDGYKWFEQIPLPNAMVTV
jgi:hypothetical protein